MTPFVQAGSRREQEVAHGQTLQRIYAWPELDGIVEDPASTTVAVYRPGQIDNPEIAAGAVTEDATTHQLYYTLDASTTSTWSLGLRCMVVFTCTFASAPTIRIKRTFVIVRTPMVHNPPCQAGDLLNANVGVEDALIQGGYLLDPDEEDPDLQEADPSRFITLAWDDILNWVESMGKTPGRIANPECLAPLLRARACALMFRALKRTGDDVHAQLEKDFTEEFEALKLNPPTLIDDPADARSPELVDIPAQVIIGVSGREHARRRAM